MSGFGGADGFGGMTGFGQFGQPFGAVNTLNTGMDIGTAGALRLWNNYLFGQASWLIILALYCIIANIGKPDLKKLNAGHGLLVFWIVWLAVMYIFFSFAGFWHQYYLCMLAPGIAGLVGIGLPEMVRAFRDRKGWKQVLLPLSLAATFIPALLHVWRYEQLRSWLAPIMVAVAAVSLVLMILYIALRRKAVLKGAVGAMLAALLIAPLYWAMTVVMYVPQNSTLPFAGPELAMSQQYYGMMPNNQAIMTEPDKATADLENYLVKNYKEGTYLVVAQRANDVAQFIVDTGLPAVPYGGFMGTDKAITVDELKQLVAEGKVTYFLMTGMNTWFGDEVSMYVMQNATLVQQYEYSGGQDWMTMPFGNMGGSTLYRFN
jgi:4-amino-4-deoxy-L-arabinose transferase-like glycosyltransferase